MNASRVALGLCLAAGVIACTKESMQPVRTVEYYRAHAQEREEALRRCADDPGRLQRDPNCINAKQAAAVEGIGSFRDLPSMGLQREPQPDPVRTEN